MPLDGALGKSSPLINMEEYCAAVKREKDKLRTALW